MRRICQVIAVLTMLGTLSADAALAPEYERIRQLHAVMTLAGDAARALYPHGAIDKIEAVGAGEFRFWAKRCFVPVILRIPETRTTPAAPGPPIEYRAELGTVQFN